MWTHSGRILQSIIQFLHYRIDDSLKHERILSKNNNSSKSHTHFDGGYLLVGRHGLYNARNRLQHLALLRVLYTHKMYDKSIPCADNNTAANNARGYY